MSNSLELLKKLYANNLDLEIWLDQRSWKIAEQALLWLDAWTYSVRGLGSAELFMNR